MNEIREKYLNSAFKDDFGNTLVFFEENGKTYMSVDGNECTEGFEEEADSAEKASEILKWYGYTELAEKLRNYK